MRKVLLIIDKERQKMVMEKSAQELLSTFADYRWVENANKLSPEEYASLFQNVEGILTSWGTPFISASILDQAPNLKIICHAAGSIKPIVCREALERGIIVTSAAPFIALSVAEMALLFTLAHLRNLIAFDKLTREKHQWEKRYSNQGLFNKKVGLVGCGSVAREFIKLLKPFRAKIKVYDPYLPGEEAERLGIKRASLKEVLSSCQVISLHAALTSQTQGMIGKKELDMISQEAILVNTARGALIDQKVLVNKLNQGKLRAAIDVTDPEPPSPDDPIRDAPHLILTPHIAGPAQDRISHMGRVAVEDMKAFFEGKEPKYAVTLDQYETMA